MDSIETDDTASSHNDEHHVKVSIDSVEPYANDNESIDDDDNVSIDDNNESIDEDDDNESIVDVESENKIKNDEL